ncbi:MULTISPECIES: hypothetical protein [unclassified Variovorax]|uniref:hypothetical protein n=1 Tax=unclassified Variovorax TaxID=663243 RepID=UPI00117CFCB4|nr:MULTISPECIES: hypothetical protein [unclassified Variovorax]QOF79514.1 hypothetical protein IG196_03680 [Variovorax sp. 38R]
MHEIDFDLVGKPPDFPQRCEAFICEGFRADGKTICTANRTYVKLGGRWYSLALEIQAIVWSAYSEQPQPWRIEEEAWDYPHVDVGSMARVIGQDLTDIKMDALPSGSRVLFRFANDQTIEISSSDDVSSYAVG